MITELRFCLSGCFINNSRTNSNVQIPFVSIELTLVRKIVFLSVLFDLWLDSWVPFSLVFFLGNRADGGVCVHCMGNYCIPHAFLSFLSCPRYTSPTFLHHCPFLKPGVLLLLGKLRVQDFLKLGRTGTGATLLQILTGQWHTQKLKGNWWSLKAAWRHRCNILGMNASA